MDDSSSLDQNAARNADLKTRTKRYALRIVKLVESLSRTQTSQVIGKQLLRCGTSVAANYRAACRARSNADFIAKMGIVEEETDESVFWIEMLVETGLIKYSLVEELLNEGNQLTAIWVSSINTARRGKR
ncbi:MAG: four helix bundle protein [Acidobacteriota bacterium]